MAVDLKSFRFTPRLSILIPAHKASKTIALALVSAIITKPSGSEILVLLDGDNTKSKTLKLFENYGIVRVFRTDQALGVAQARNFLIGQAQAELISWLDADDIALPFRYGFAVRSIERAEFDVAFSSSIIFGKRLRVLPILPQVPYRISSELSPLFLWLANPFVQSTMVARKSAILAVGGYRDCAAEDYDLWMRLIVDGRKLVRRRGYGVLYRLHDSQITAETEHGERVHSDVLIRQSKLELGKTIMASGLTSGNLTATQVRDVLLQRSKGYKFQELFFRNVIDAAKRVFLGQPTR